jgi:hypothetical protein
MEEDAGTRGFFKAFFFSTIYKNVLMQVRSGGQYDNLPSG